MKRVGLIFGGLLAAVGVLFAPAVAHANVNDFTIANYAIEYNLSTDKEGRSVLQTTETITADFPSSNQNHGIERAIPKKYQGHTVDLSIDHVSDQNNKALKYTTYNDDNDNLVVRIGDANKYVHGMQTYKIVYTEHDVTGYFSDTKDDEFYWDTDGTGWQVPIQNLSVTLNVASNIAETLNGQTSCYSGANGSTDQCQLTKNGDTFTASAKNLAAGDNVTLAIGFTPGTFRGYEMSEADIIAQILVIVWFSLWGVGIIVIVVVGIWYTRLRDRKKEIGTIVPEYTPPSDVSVSTSASILAPIGKPVFAAQLIDFAVRGYLSLQELEQQTWIFKSKDYRITIIKSIDDLLDEEKEVLNDIFLNTTTVGQSLQLSDLRNNPSVYLATLDNETKLNKLIRGTYGLRAKDPAASHKLRVTALVLIIAAVLTLNPVFALASFISFVLSFALWPLSDKGVALVRYLKGLKLYVKVAEADRIKMLQSVEGAEKTGIDPDNKEQLVKLYEKMLPYAMLFGYETSWNQQIGQYYESLGTQPLWYTGLTPGFSAVAFSSAMTTFSTSATYSAGSSSTGGGSAGGGASGGGGGGGGGGGW